MNDDYAILKRFENLSVWKKGDQRAPHKPLLALYALGRCMRGEPRLVQFGVVDDALRQLLVEFGPPRRSFHPEYPFWRLQNDGIWEVISEVELQPRKGNTDPKKSELIEYRAAGGFPKDIYGVLRAKPTLISHLADRLVSRHFPTSLHTDILAAVGLPTTAASTPPSARSAEFREDVLRAYQRQCAVCGFNVRLGNSDLALEAAHIRWHQVGGPDNITNGVCLCVLHHRLFDRGAMGISPDGLILVSEDVHGSKGLQKWLLGFEGSRLVRPQRSEYYPATVFVGWHLREVFRGPPRDS
jgi:putative restriction endonuclease